MRNDHHFTLDTVSYYLAPILLPILREFSHALSGLESSPTGQVYLKVLDEGWHCLSGYRLDISYILNLRQIVNGVAEDAKAKHKASTRERACAIFSHASASA
jgi:hypothetical protein